jgi:hypothetical protein
MGRHFSHGLAEDGRIRRSGRGLSVRSSTPRPFPPGAQMVGRPPEVIDKLIRQPALCGSNRVLIDTGIGRAPQAAPRDGP